MSDYYLRTETEAQMMQQQEAQYRYMQSVPGLIKPVDVDMDPDL